MSHQNYYTNNKQYTKIVEQQTPSSFHKYVDYIGRYVGQDSENRILDVGCGTGTALGLLKEQDANRELFGVEISQPSVAQCREKKLNCVVYNGKSIPFPNNYFSVVASHNILEHVDNVENTLSESIRVLKRDGYLVVACPNFLSITNNYHHHTAGFRQKLFNLKNLIIKSFSKDTHFNKMATIDRGVFHADDDACNVTNPIDILKWAKGNELTTIYWSSQSVYRKSWYINLVDKTFLRVFFGSSFFVFKK